MIRLSRVSLFTFLALSLLLSTAASAAEDSIFMSDVDSDQKPWTHLNFRNHPEAFQFAIVSDRTGGERKGIFPKAVERLNLMQPEFVLSVGDLIEGYTEDMAVIQEQWEEFDRFAAGFEMPFFHLAGNHDVTNDLMTDIWKERFGRNYYSFVYRDVLFMVLDSQDGEKDEGQTRYASGFSPAQVEYIQSVLNKHRGARWTLIFMHQPLWEHDQPGQEKELSSFSKLEQMLANRPHTVFAGHWHSYMKYAKENGNYYRFATTGGGSSVRGNHFGEFDHVVWVTMTEAGPVLANLTLDGILPDDVVTEASKERHEALYQPFERIQGAAEGDSGEIAVEFENKYGEGLLARVDWQTPDGSPWAVEPSHSEVAVSANERAQFVWQISLVDPTADFASRFLFPVPRISAETPSEVLLDDFQGDATAAFLNLLPPSRCEAAAAAPDIDGRLDDPIWQTEPTVASFHHIDLKGEPSMKSQAWVRYDDRNLYIAFRAWESQWDTVKANVEEHDGPVWEDDALEIFLDPDFDRQGYYQVIVNSLGVTYDLNDGSSAWEGEYQCRVNRTGEFWTVELAMPWSTLEMSEPPAPGTRIGFELQRDRSREEFEVMQSTPTFGMAYQHPERYGVLLFVEP